MASYNGEDLEKDVPEATHLEKSFSKLSDSGRDSLNDARIDQFTPEQQRKIIWRIDKRLVLTLGFMYCVSLMDRTNTGIAVVAGMGVDLVLTGNRYSVMVLVFFITYVLLQPPATVVLRKVGPRLFLPTITLLWGCTMICFGFVTSWVDLLPLRLILGIFEAGFFPGCAYLLSCWYPRYELQKRNAVFYLIGSMASAFSGILAFGFSQLKNHGSLPKEYGQHYSPTLEDPTAPSGIEPGIAGWRWIFILQGTLTALVGILGYVLIVDFPEKAQTAKGFFNLRFLNDDEAAFVVARIEKDRHDAIPEEFYWSSYLKGGLDLKVWGFAALFGLTTTNTYGIAYFLPIILNDGLGFSVAASECLIAPPYVAAAIVMYAFAWAGDKYHIRSPFIIFNGCLSLVGLPLLAFAHSDAVRYFGVFLTTIACNANVPCILTWQANNIRGQWKRALCSATLVGAGGIGGIVGSTVFREQDKPAYHPGIYAVMIASGLILIITSSMVFKFNQANKRAAADGKVIAGMQGFRYTL